MTRVPLALGLRGAAVVALALIVVAAAPIRFVAPTGTTLPPLGASALIASMRRAAPVALAATVLIDAPLGTLGWAGYPGSGVARLWADGAGRRRIALPDEQGERTFVDDGHTVWLWNSATRSVTRAPARPAAWTPPWPSVTVATPPSGAPARPGESASLGSPVDTAEGMLASLASDSRIRLDAPASVAGRAAYQLVLAPVATERTLLREVRIAVDERSRVPLAVSVLANGSTEPVLQLRFASVRFGPQDPALFRFAPAAGVPVRAVANPPAAHPPATKAAPTERLIGRGWDTVRVERLPGRCPRIRDRKVGEVISGSWGHGRLLRNPLGEAVITADCRVAVGAVPVQVLTEALAR
jgi:outer membrane lipoprotein-sorting protein